jgi:signal transduction histidine kinase
LSPKSALNNIWGDAGYLDNPDSYRPLITLRFYAVVALFLTSGIFYSFDLGISYLPILIISISVLLYNVVYSLILGSGKSFSGFLLLQVIIDWIALFFVALYTGGIASPAIFVFPVYGAVVGFILESTPSTLLAGFGSALIISILGRDIILGNIHSNGIIYSIGTALIYCSVLFIITLLSIWISGNLRFKLKTIEGLQKKIDVDNERLRKSHELSINMNADLTLEGTLKAITSTISKSPNITACVIRLLTDDGKRIKIMDTSGVSEEHASRESVFLENSLIDFETITIREPLYIPDVLSDARFEYRDDATAENLVSMICIPLIVRDTPLGVIRCYTNRFYEFTENDVKFLDTVATSASLSISSSNQFQKLERLNKTRSAFLRLATHELRSPMAAIQSILHLVLEGFTGKITRKQRELFERANKRIDRLLLLVSELLELEGFSEKEMEFSNCNLHDILSNVVRDIAPKSDAKGIKMRVHIPHGDLTISCDSDSIYRVLENLVDNAVKYSKEQGVVMIIVDELTDSVSIEIIDNGIGIPEDDLKNLFMEFFRSKNARKMEVHGTGLGLSIVKKIVESHSGAIEVSSKIGEGTRFKIILPIHHNNKAT